MEKEELIYIPSENVKCCSCRGKWYGGYSEELKIELPFDPAILLWGIYPKELKAESRRDICTIMFIAVLFIIVKR